ncbi:MAG TPA: AAA family ATPase [Acidimicrobiales bacterium]|jgi:pilus assembly protein CpaE|nr:AAA family ATPase [Acidimicrobiales bacterium]
MGSVSSVDLHEAPYSVAVVDDDPKLRTRLAMQLGESARAAAYASLNAVDQRGATTATVLVLGPSYVDADALGEVARLTRGRPDLGAVLVVPEISTDVLQLALRSGIRDVVPMSGDADQLLEAIARTGETLQAPPSAPNLVAVPGGAGTDRARTITVFSTKGGAGKSFVAINLAAVLARRNDKPVVVVDADLQFGDVAVMLGLVPQHTIIDAVNQIDRLDESLLKSMLIKHDATGVFVLPAPIEPAFADSVSLQHLQRIIEVLSSFCSYVIIDTPARFDDIVLGVLEATDDIVLMAGMDIPHIKNTKIGLQTLRLLHIPSSKVKLTLNRANSKVKLDIADVERTLQMKADCLLPSEIAVPQSINKGVPVVIDAPRSGVSRNLERLADLFPALSEESAGGR